MMVCFKKSIKSHLNNFGMYDKNSNFEIQANISHSSESLYYKY